METFQEQKAYFKKRWPELKEALIDGGPRAVAARIAAIADPLERRVLFLFCRQGMMNEDWDDKSLDAFIEMADLGIAELLAQAKAEQQPEKRSRRIDAANIISYNLAADLADCWPGDSLSRDARHFERGLQAAGDCLRWREELGKGPGPLHMAWWAKGMHEISLARHSEAVTSFERALAYGREMAGERGQSVEIGSAGVFAPILSTGYLGIAKSLAADPQGEKLYARAIAAFTDQLENEGKRDDAQFGIEQLETVRARYCTPK